MKFSTYAVSLRKQETRKNHFRSIYRRTKTIVTDPIKSKFELLMSLQAGFGASRKFYSLAQFGKKLKKSEGEEICSVISPSRGC